jgi:hypothetical protein
VGEYRGDIEILLSDLHIADGSVSDAVGMVSKRSTSGSWLRLQQWLSEYAPGVLQSASG